MRKTKIIILFSVFLLLASFTSCKSIPALLNHSKGIESTAETPVKNQRIHSDSYSSFKNLQCRKYPGQDVKLVPYNGVVEHIFVHPLIAYPTLAFVKGDQIQGYNDWFITVSEFNKIIQSLYSKNFILVDINTIYEEKDVNGKKELCRKQLMLPENKKPIILSVDDLNYYDYMLRDGNVHKLILDKDGNIATYSKDLGGKDVVSYDNEVIPILEQFIYEHPDFSYNNARGTIALTGYEGILGYRTQSGSKNRDEEKKEVVKVIEKLKSMGWNFASHGYGHLNAAQVSYNTFVRDTEKWKDEVESLIGPTQVYIYPFGSRVLPNDSKFDYLVKSGFKILCAVGPTSYEKITPYAVMTDRRHVDGISLHSQRKSLLDLFDSNEIIDSTRPNIY